MIKKAILYMIISTFAFTLLNVTVKKLVYYDTAQIVFFRSLGSLIFTTGFIIYYKLPLIGNNNKLLILRSFVGLMSMSLFFMSLKYLNVGSAVTLRYLSPIFAAIMAILFLKEKIRHIQWLFFLIAFIGVIILKSSDIQINTIGLSLILGSAFFGGLVYIVINKIGNTEHPITVVNYFMIIATIAGGILSIFNWKTPLAKDWLPLLSLGVYGFFGQLYMTKAFQLTTVNIIAPLKYIEVIFTVIIGVLLFKEVYNIWSLLGIILIISGLILNIIYKK